MDYLQVLPLSTFIVRASLEEPGPADCRSGRRRVVTAARPAVVFLAGAPLPLAFECALDLRLGCTVCEGALLAEPAVPLLVMQAERNGFWCSSRLASRTARFLANLLSLAQGFHDEDFVRVWDVLMLEWAPVTALATSCRCVPMTNL